MISNEKGRVYTKEDLESIKECYNLDAELIIKGIYDEMIKEALINRRMLKALKKYYLWNEPPILSDSDICYWVKKIEKS